MCVLAISLCSVTPSRADNSLDVVADVIMVRPACLVVTAFGAVFFVVTLPLAAPSGSIKKTANTMVVKPAQATFTRPLGDFSEMED
jgi:hypothetical protein